MSDRKPLRHVSILAGLGAEAFRLGLRQEDQHAWRGVLEMSLCGFAEATSRMDDQLQLTVGKAIARLVKPDLGALSSFGEATLFMRQADAYKADCDSWAAQSERVKVGSWRKRPPTRGQRLLMIRMSQSLNIPLPEEITRGEAADWIAAQGGNPRFKQEN